MAENHEKSAFLVLSTYSKNRAKLSYYAKIYRIIFNLTA
jgi:hypothetical protein